MEIIKHLKFLVLALILIGCEKTITLSELIKIGVDEDAPAASGDKVTEKIPPNIQFQGVISRANDSNSTSATDLIGHTNQVIDLDFSPDGQLIATASYDKTIRLWSVGSESKPKILRGHKKGVHSVAISPKGTYIASGGWDRKIILWHLLTGKKYKILSHHRKGISALAFTPDGKMLLSGDYEGKLNVWNVKSGRFLGSLSGHNFAIQDIKVSPNGKIAASAGADRDVHIWDIASLTEIKRLSGHRGLIKSLIFTPDGRFLFSGGSDDNIFMWNVTDGSRVRTIGNSFRSVNSLSISSDGRRLLIADNNTIHIWDLELEERITSLNQHRGIVSSARFSPNGHLVGSVSYDKSVKLWEAPLGIVAVKEGLLVTQDSTVELIGSVSDNDLLQSVTLNGKPLSISADGSFNLSKELLIGNNQFILAAVDEHGNKSEYTLLVERRVKDAFGDSFPKIILPKQRGGVNKNRVAIIIGIEDYDNVPSAQYAVNDSRVFYEFATNVLAVPTDQIRLLYGKKATRAAILKVFSNWLKGFANNPDTEIFIFYSGHGMSEADGSDAYFLPVDGDPALLRDTAISRRRLLEDLEAINAKSSTLFLDTCYSGTTRNGEAIVPSQKPIVIAPSEWKGFSPGISVFSAASKSEIAISLKEQKHGLFSYYLMRALNGEADNPPNGNGDGQLSLKEISDFVGPKVSRIASSRGQKQNPQLLGAPSTIIASW